LRSNRKADQARLPASGYSVFATAKTQTNPVEKAIWFIESHSAQEFTLDDIAQAVGISRYHLSRAFGFATGWSVMRYLRARRLSEAARRLAGGAPDILEVALDAGYGSHEAFTRAFGEQFGMAPEAVRARSRANNIKLLEAIKMDETLLAHLDPPRIEQGRTKFIAGLGERYTAETCVNIPAQWQRFVPHLRRIPGQLGRTAYGVLCNSDDAGNAEYISGVEVPDFARVPKDWSRIRIPPQKYAVFHQPDHISTVRRTFYTIWNRSLPEAGLKPAEGPEFERYGEEFNSQTGAGGFEIWIPIQA
jgi:AraC family transcriptional regulator